MGGVGSNSNYNPNSAGGGYGIGAPDMDNVINSVSGAFFVRIIHGIHRHHHRCHHRQLDRRMAPSSSNSFSSMSAPREIQGMRGEDRNGMERLTREYDEQQNALGINQLFGQYSVLERG